MLKLNNKFEIKLESKVWPADQAKSLTKLSSSALHLKDEIVKKKLMSNEDVERVLDLAT
jgi:hypothetical protein